MGHLARKANVTIRKMSSNVYFDKVGHTGLITLNRPKFLNVYNRGMSEAILDKLVEYGRDDNIEVVCIRSSGSKAFCAGGDIINLMSLPSFAVEDQIQDLIGNYPKPYVALTDGIAFGGGMGLAVNGSFTVATENSLFAMPETAIGHFACDCASYSLSRLYKPLGMFLALTGTKINGNEAKHLGLVSHCIPSFALENFMTDYIRTLDKNNINSCLDNFEEQHDIKSQCEPVSNLEEHSSTIYECFSAPTVPKIVAKLQKDPSQFASKILSKLSKMSPISLCITHKMQTLGARLTFTDCMRMEFNAGVHVLNRNELKEGVRALLIDKDKSPKWNPSSLDQVTDEMVDRYFQPCDGPVWQPGSLLLNDSD